jgi:hypothetical protein
MGGSQKCLRIQEEFVKGVLYQLCCLSCQWISWLQDLETIKILRHEIPFQRIKSLCKVNENYSPFYVIYICIVYDILYLSKIKTNKSIFYIPCLIYVNYYIYNKSYNEALMSYSQRSSILSLLFKKGDPLCLDNYRPISLLNVDLKLI